MLSSRKKSSVSRRRLVSGLWHRDPWEERGGEAIEGVIEGDIKGVVREGRSLGVELGVKPAGLLSSATGGVATAAGSVKDRRHGVP